MMMPQPLAKVLENHLKKGPHTPRKGQPQAPLEADHISHPTEGNTTVQADQRIGKPQGATDSREIH